MNQIQALERAALAAFRNGQRWAEYWPTVAERVRTCEPYSRERFRRLIDRLLHLLVSGNLDGQLPVDAVAPWDVDDSPTPSDTVTHARYLFPMNEVPR